MNISECMSKEIRMVTPSDTIRKAAHLMSKFSIGYLPVVWEDRIVGAITDRDIVVRAIAKDNVNASIEEVMTRHVYYCFDDQKVEDVAQIMANLHVRRLPVVNRKKKLVGVVSLGDLSKSPMLSDILKKTYQQVTTH